MGMLNNQMVIIVHSYLIFFPHPGRIADVMEVPLQSAVAHIALENGRISSDLSGDHEDLMFILGYVITGWWFEPSEKYGFVSWDNYSKYMEKQKMFQTTNQIIIYNPAHLGGPNPVSLQHFLDLKYQSSRFPRISNT